MPSMADIGAALAHDTRARALQALLSGRLLSMSDLARSCRVPASSMSEHLAVLVQRGLLRVVQSGRHRYFSLASDDVAAFVEAAGIVAREEPVIRTLAESETRRLEREGRFCWKHLAGGIGIALRAALLREDALRACGDDAIVTESGSQFFKQRWAIEAEAGLIVPSCVDFTERRLHMRGKLAAEIARRFIERHWIRHGPGRCAILTESGRLALDLSGALREIQAIRD